MIHKPLKPSSGIKQSKLRENVRAKKPILQRFLMLTGKCKEEIWLVYIPASAHCTDTVSSWFCQWHGMLVVNCSHVQLNLHPVQYDAVQFSFVTRCQGYCTRNVSWYQACSQIHTNCKMTNLQQKLESKVIDKKIRKTYNQHKSCTYPAWKTPNINIMFNILSKWPICRLLHNSYFLHWHGSFYIMLISLTLCFSVSSQPSVSTLFSSWVIIRSFFKWFRVKKLRTISEVSHMWQIQTFTCPSV